MYVDKVSLGNIRGFEELEFSLARPDGSHAGWTVFTGDNGSGKSTLLKAIAIALTGRETARALQPSFRRWIREGNHEATLELGIAGVEGDDFATEAGRRPEKVFGARLALRNGQKEPSLEVVQPGGNKRKNYKTPERTPPCQCPPRQLPLPNY